MKVVILVIVLFVIAYFVDAARQQNAIEQGRIPAPTEQGVPAQNLNTCRTVRPSMSSEVYFVFDNPELCYQFAERFPEGGVYPTRFPFMPPFLCTNESADIYADETWREALCP